jgi:CRISPR system Cascade subunit CasD
VPTFLLLRLEGPLQAWGDVAFDPRRPTRAYPSRSGLAGLLANALGWRHRDGARTTALQDALRYAVREDVPPRLVSDYQTADLGAIGDAGWTRWGVEKRGGSASDGTHILEKWYLADGSFIAAVTVGAGASVLVDELEEAMRRPARPLFLGRKGCPPSTRILEGAVEAETAYDALKLARPPERRGAVRSCRCWYAVGEGPDPAAAQVQEVWDRRDFITQRFTGSRTLVEGQMTLPALA